MTKDEVLNLRVPAEVKAALKRAAEADDRSVSGMALRIIREWLDQHNNLPIYSLRKLKPSSSLKQIAGRPRSKQK